MRGFNKFRNIKINNATFGKFDSTLEYNTFLYLLALQQHGKISELKRQVAIDLTPLKQKHKVKYVCDFLYKDKERGLIIADAKGMLRPEYRVKREWLLYQYKGFVFIEFYKEQIKEYRPSGDLDLKESIFEKIKYK